MNEREPNFMSLVFFISICYDERNQLSRFFFNFDETIKNVSKNLNFHKSLRLTL